ncbi:helix-turn-helix domain-containing protein [Flavobacterium quisquiliarum]|uniref:Helix-turn-helix domain-containing protein n=1 Tax=Flavobacterium quisquiliarum TaxID=1834436 RepID=A0ABV8W1T3_9FLAO|nr:helix-turn-helix transcriptional regulator [Flavobacterium quisquiliarum]MBW1654641.1 helix-turn-helix domain-containing protein [Flavobacterium quisquiliarum]NWL01675.1 XRE family transcriptional regulator [Flavobacterium collinsii]
MAVNINNSIKNIRELKNYTQEYVADRLGMTQAGYSKIEKGISKVSLKKLQEIAAVLEVSMQSIIQFESEQYFEKRTSESNTIKSTDYIFVCQLLKDKIILLEKLQYKMDLELKSYRDKFGML